VGETVRIRLPSEGEMIAKVLELLGDDRVRVICPDGKIRIARIPGKVQEKALAKSWRLRHNSSMGLSAR